MAPRSASPTGDIGLTITAFPSVYTPCKVKATATYTMVPLLALPAFAPFSASIPVSASSTVETVPGCSQH